MKKTVLRSRLTDAQFIEIERYACDRLDSLEAAMINWRDERKIFEAQMQDQFEWRKSSGKDDPDGRGEIFERSNESLNIVGGFAEFISARAQDDLLGSEPFYAAEPQGKDDKDFADKMQRHSEWKLGSSTFKGAALEAPPLACGIGEAVMKVRFREETDYFEGQRTVLCEGGKPIVTLDGDYIYSGDEIVTVDGNGQEYPSSKDIPLPPGVKAKDFAKSLRTFPRKDPETNLAGRKTTWKEMAVEQPIVRYKNVDAYNVHFLNFIAPLNLPTLEDGVSEALVGQTFEMSLFDMQAMLNGGIYEDVLQSLSQGSADPKADGTTKPRENSAEVAEGRNDELAIKNPTLKWAEAYWSYYLPGAKAGDAPRKVRMFGIIAREAKKLVFCEYLGIVTPKGRLPYFPVRAFKVPGRWYGRGYYEIFAMAQRFIDAQLNLVADGNATRRVAGKFMQRDAIENVEEEGEMEWDPHEVQFLKQGKTAKDALEIVVLPDLDSRTMEMLNLMIQIIRARSGVTNTAQGELSSQSVPATARGTEAIINSGSVLAKVPIMSISEGLGRALEFAILTIYFHFDAEEAFTYLEGNQTLIDRMTPEEVENLDVDVRMIMTRFRQREQRENAADAATAVLQYLTAVPDQYKEAVRPFYVQIVKGYGFDQADDAVPKPVALPPPTDAGQKVSVSMSYKDAPDDVRREIEGAAGLQPSQQSAAGGPVATGPDGQPIPPQQQAASAL